jgi:ferredoxin-like protein FixX
MIDTQEFIKLVYKDVPEEDFLQVVTENCDGCGHCAVVCPSILWKMREKKAQLVADYKLKCLECGACWQVCEPRAILFEFPKGGTGIIVKFG